MDNISEEEYGVSYIACKKCGSLYPAGGVETVKSHFKNCTGDPRQSGASLVAVDMGASENIPSKTNSQHQQDTPNSRTRSTPTLSNNTAVEAKDPERMTHAKSPSSNNLSVETRPNDLPVENAMSLKTSTTPSKSLNSKCQTEEAACDQGKMTRSTKNDSSGCSRNDPSKEPPRIVKKTKRPSWAKTQSDFLMGVETFRSITQMDDEAMMSVAYDMAINGLSEKLEAAMNKKPAKRNRATPRTPQNENRATPVDPSQDDNCAKPVDALQGQNHATPLDPSEDGNHATPVDTSDLYNGIPKSMLRNSEHFLKLKRIKDKYSQYCEVNNATTDKSEPSETSDTSPITESALQPECRKNNVEEMRNGNMVLPGVRGVAKSTASNSSSVRVTRSQKLHKEVGPQWRNDPDAVSEGADATASSSPRVRPQRQAAAKCMSKLPSFTNTEDKSEYYSYNASPDQREPGTDLSMETSDTSLIPESDMGDLQPDCRKQNGNYVCDLCGHKTKHAGFFKRHMAAHNDGGVHVCKFDGCKFTCLLKSRLKLHTKTHTLVRGKNLVCETCGALFSDSGSLNRHKGLHSETLPYVCGECGYASAYKNALTEHLRKHTDNYLQCDYEGCTFRSVYGRALQTHRRSHDDSQKVICELCGFTTGDKGTFQLHKKMHAGKKDYQCSRCKYQGYTKSEVARHYRGVHLKEKAYCCDQCDFKSSYLTGLRIHLMAHAGIKPYQCSACSYASSVPTKTKRHIKKVHPDAKLIKLNVPFQLDVKKYKPAQPNPKSDIVIIKLMDGAENDQTEMEASVYNVENEAAMADSQNVTEGPHDVILKEVAVVHHENVGNVVLAYMCLDCASFYSHKAEFETHLAECGAKEHDDRQMETLLPESFIVEDGALTIIENIVN